MLKATMRQEKIFELIDLHDKKFVEELSVQKGKGLLLEEYWDYAYSI